MASTQLQEDVEQEHFKLDVDYTVLRAANLLESFHGCESYERQLDS